MLFSVRLDRPASFNSGLCGGSVRRVKRSEGHRAASILNRWAAPPQSRRLTSLKLMTDFVTLTCPSCGGSLQITNDIERFACAHCGTEHIVKRGGGVVSLTPVIERLAKVQIGVDKTASELAIKRLQEEIQAIQSTQSDVAR